MAETDLRKSETYDRLQCAVFLKTKEKWGGLSNMAGGFPLRVNGIDIRTAEALYQCCRYPDDPETQQWVLDQKSPMWTKKVPGRDRRSRADWNEIRVEVMRWCLRVKLAQHLEEFGALLWITEQRPIVEESGKDDFWGTFAQENGTLVGSNVLGKLLMELRAEFKTGDRNRLKSVQPLSIPNFRLMGEGIGVVG
jgi:type I restriction enzyme S subunit